MARKSTTAPGRTVVLYDGLCRFCTSQVGKLQRGAASGGRQLSLRIRKRGKHPRLPINKQTGRLHFAVRISKHRSTRRQFFDIGPSARAGRSMWVLKPGGTRYMVARGFWRETRRRWRARNDGLIKAFTRN